MYEISMNIFWAYIALWLRWHSLSSIFGSGLGPRGMCCGLPSSSSGTVSIIGSGAVSFFNSSTDECREVWCEPPSPKKDKCQKKKPGEIMSRKMRNFFYWVSEKCQQNEKKLNGSKLCQKSGFRKNLNSKTYNRKKWRKTKIKKKNNKKINNKKTT